MHQYYKAVKDDGWFTRLLLRLGLKGAPVGTTIGPIPYITCNDGPNRKERRKSQAIWRRYGELAQKIAKRRNIDINSALKIAMEVK